jgi:hypothetical protein
LGLDILMDLVDDALISRIAPAGKQRHHVTPLSALANLKQMFGQTNESMHSMLRSSLFSLKQGPAEPVKDYLQRADNLHNSLLSAGGRMSSSAYLQCLKEGVAEHLLITVRMFEMGKEHTATALAGVLLAEECKLARRTSLREGTGGGVSGAQNFAMALQQMDIPAAAKTQLQDIVALMTPAGGAQKWTPKPPSSARTSAAPSGLPTKEERMAASAGTSTCWNCGILGHRLTHCPKTLEKPWKFKPTEWVPRFMRPREPKHSALPAPAPPPGPVVS